MSKPPSERAATAAKRDSRESLISATTSTMRSSLAAAGYLRADGDGWIKPRPTPAHYERFFPTTEAAHAHLHANISRALDDPMRLAESAIKDPVEAVGVKADASKLRYDLLPEEAVRAVVRVLTFGAKKYSAWNWMKVPEWRPRYYAAAMRHIEADRRGEKFDPETGEPHLAHALCCLVFMLCLGGAEPEKKP